MRWMFLFFGLAGTTLSAQTPALDEARVQIPYKELKALLDASKARPQAESPISSSILSATYHVEMGRGSLAGRADYEVQTFRDGPHVVPLAGEALILESVEPAEAMVVLHDAQYALVVEGRQRVKASLKFTLPIRETEGGTVAECRISPAVTSSVTVKNISGDRVPGVENAVFSVDTAEGARWQLGRSPLLRITRRSEPKPLPPPITMPAVIRQATCETRVVTDGAYSNKMVWHIRHQAPLVWKIALPETMQVVSARIGGQPASPSRLDASTLELRLPEPPAGGETEVELSYTGRGAAFDPVRGDLALSLPATPLLIETLKWNVSIPAAYETRAAQGNVDFLTGEKPGSIALGKELCQGESPHVRLYYQKPETVKKP